VRPSSLSRRRPPFRLCAAPFVGFLNAATRQCCSCGPPLRAPCVFTSRPSFSHSLLKTLQFPSPPPLAFPSSRKINKNRKKKSKREQLQPQQPERKEAPPPSASKQAPLRQQMTYVIQQPHPQTATHHQQLQQLQPLQPKQEKTSSSPSAAATTVGKAGSAVPQRWAGPAFSNSPAPASLPVPSFASLGTAAVATGTASQPVAVPPRAAVDPGADIMQMLGQQQSPPGRGTTLQQTAAASTPPQHQHAASAPNLMAMLNIKAPLSPAFVHRPFSPAPAAPVAGAVAASSLISKTSASSMLLTPDRLAAMVAAKGAARIFGEAPQTDRSVKLLSMLGVGSSGTLAPPLADASSFVSSPQPLPLQHRLSSPPSSSFALLMQKLETSA